MTDRITYYQTHYTRELRARCDCCATVWATWDSDDLDYHTDECECQNQTHQHKETR